ncbi:fumarylacetoacetate hydrolase family protein [Corynebacterium flavescens]|uniref:fumarylacetoacetate hydrolase family protein n=1 Tax=Corynebacterium flavescens TaxID=28028 RepID=UPI0026478EC9|nr:fumarylacetoacetate hydrolase family protein [Corynebacterium flavescens]MDN6430780.1 fumarylacetoacetate hydrolase family protein [Corynebacterium flavescens]MDN6475192.1 fumarylacetoacetate hydrolase family protein [Corynebacterium flavescens]MDN6530897.1 fumarylacetoacetate hydrolase family protein [Corynebacterium flavescens]MDN6553253.1 fumarylacetoacetate hydrolase family protein [Corynebacterium flavescens]MDN6601970.1 fumarylacetoacetate hydrolase family protein [Corynebacterium fla
MKLATLRTAYGTTAIRIDAPRVGVELDFDDVGALLRSEDWRKSAHISGEPLVFDPADLDAVLPTPGKIICVGLNYAKHIREMGRDFPEFPTLFIKFPEALTGPYDDIFIPDYATSQLDYEGELAVVIGQRAHQVTRADALEYVAGYAIMNDYTLRDFQRRTSQFHAGKSFYKTAGFGPWLTTADEWSPGSHAKLTTIVDGQVRQSDDTDDLIFSVAELIEFCSHIYPLNPGDVIVTGTPEGVGFARDPQAFIHDGQSVDIDIEGLGHISNTTHFGAAPETCGEDCSCHS